MGATELCVHIVGEVRVVVSVGSHAGEEAQGAEGECFGSGIEAVGEQLWCRQGA